LAQRQKQIVEIKDSSWRFGGSTLAILVSVLALGGTMLLYGDALQLPFFFDDMIHLRWLDWHSLSTIWTTGEGLGYYRPLTMSVWKIGHLILGYNDPGECHLLNLLLHALNAALVGVIGWRACQGRGRLFYTLLATLIFASFPFSYQAVPSTSSLSKPLIATLTLGSVVLYWEARLRRSRRLGAASLLTALLAPFAYEVGVMVPVAILATEVLAYSRREFDRFSRLPVLYFLLVWGIALPVVVVLEPETGASVGLPRLLDLWQNGTYFAQALVFPLAPITTPLERILEVDRYVLLALVDLVCLVGLLLFYRWVKQMRLFWYAAAWFVVGVLPLWLQLDFSYVITSPRILYLGAAGVALLWAGVPVFLWTRLPARWWPKAVAVAIAAGLLAFNSAYIRDKMVLADEMAVPLWRAADAGQTAGSAAPLLYVNVPAWIAPKEPVYRVGTEGFTFIPEYVRVQDFVYVNTGIEPEVQAVMFDPVKEDWKAYIGYSGETADWGALAQQIRRVEGVYVTTYRPEGLGFAEAGAVEQAANPTAASEASARFGDQVLLLDYQVEATGPELVVTLWWYCLQIPEEDITVFLHVYDGAGKLIAQGDGYPLSGMFPARQWRPGEVVRDIRHITLPEGVANEPYAVAVGWYNAATAQRLPAFDPQGQPMANDTVVLSRP
jgi:hypothetical protein